jgi:F0F1-type ATP synthase assembly protein I
MRARDDGSAAGRREAIRGLDQSSVMGVELVSATIVWAGAGWLVDGWLGTSPWFFAVGAIVGNAAGIYLVWLRGGRLESGGRRQLPDPSAGEGEWSARGPDR